MQNAAGKLRLILLFANAATAALIGVRVAQYPLYLSFSGASLLLWEAGGMLALYFALTFVLTRDLAADGRRLALVTRFGMAAACIQVLHVIVERFVTFPGRWNGVATLCFMLATFVCWATVAFGVRRSGQTVWCSLRSAIWAAMITMGLAVCFGVLFELYIAPLPPEQMRFWPEFVRSGWNDLHAFAIANTVDSVMSHLLIAPVVALIVGALALVPAIWLNANTSRVRETKRTL